MTSTFASPDRGGNRTSRTTGFRWAGRTKTISGNVPARRAIARAVRAIGAPQDSRLCAVTRNDAPALDPPQVGVLYRKGRMPPHAAGRR